MDLLNKVKEKVPSAPEMPDIGKKLEESKAAGEELNPMERFSSFIPPIPAKDLDLDALANFTPTSMKLNPAGLSSFAFRSSGPVDPLARTGPEHYFRKLPIYQPRIMYKARGMYDMGRGLHPVANHYKIHDTMNIPGKGDCSVYRAKYQYRPRRDSPNENFKEELEFSAGDYFLVWKEPERAAEGEMDDKKDTFLSADLLPTRNGLIPSNYMQRLVGTTLLDFFHPYLKGNLTLRPEDRFNCIFDHEFESQGLVVLPPRNLLVIQDERTWTLRWQEPTKIADGFDSYHVYVNGIIRCVVKYGEVKKAVVEGLDRDLSHRMSVRSSMATGKCSLDSECTLLVGSLEDIAAPLCVRAKDIRGSTATVIWFPAQTGRKHNVYLGEDYLATAEPGVHQFSLQGLQTSTLYIVSVTTKLDPPPEDASAESEPVEEGTEEEKEEPILESEPTSFSFTSLDKDFLPPKTVTLEPDLENKILRVSWTPVKHRKIYVKGRRVPETVLVSGYAVLVNGVKIWEIEGALESQGEIEMSRSDVFLPKGANTVMVRTRYSEHEEELGYSEDSEVKSFAINPAQRKKNVRYQGDDLFGVA